MATAPVAVVMYDLAFRFDSFREAFARRRALYAGLASTWIVTVLLLIGAPRTQTAGFSTSVTLWTYLLNQAVMLTHYLRIAFWPRGLVLNYGRPVALTLSAVLPQALLIVALLGASLWLWTKSRPAAFAGLFFFLTLAPTSLVPIVTEVGAERRMYLPLIAIVGICVLGVFAVARRFRLLPTAGLTAAAAIVAVAFSATVFARNREYASELTLARTNLERWPSSVAEAMAGVAAGSAGLRDEAIKHFEDAVAQGNVEANYPLAIELMEGGHPDQAIPKLEALLSHPGEFSAAIEAAARRAVADAYLDQQDFERARAAYVLYLERRPSDTEALDRLGRTQATLEEHKEAAATFARLVEVSPRNPEAWNSLVIELLRAGDVDAAEQRARQALVIKADDARMVDLLGRVMLARNRPDDAVKEFERALAIDPQYAPSKESLANLRR
jgi:tetratricopeptide (TPR) repeat protein